MKGREAGILRSIGSRLRIAHRAARSGAALLVLAASSALSARAADLPADAVPVVALEVSPAAEPRPALKYRLWADLLEEQPGNAAPYYYRAIVLLRSVPEASRKAFDEKHKEWLEVPLDKLPREEVDKQLADFKSALGQLEIAALRETCDWELRFRDLRGPETVSFLLPELQELRTLARILEVRIRRQLAEGKLDAALGSLRTGYRMGHACQQTPTLVNGLVGIAVCMMMHDRTLELIRQPEAPNLYWALATLPRPTIDLHAAMRTEMSLVPMLFPVLRDAETAELTAGEWQRRLDELVETLVSVTGGKGDVVDQALPPEFAWLRVAGWRVASTTWFLANRGAARTRVIARGIPAERVDAMSLAQLVLVDTAGTFAEIRDETLKASLLPMPHATRLLQEAEERLAKRGKFGKLPPQEIVPLASLLLPAVTRAGMAQWRLDRRLRELMTIEALRHHAARSNGAWPKSLDDLRELPALHDAFEQQPFGFSVAGETAVLESRPVSGMPNAYVARRYEIVLRKPIRP